MFANSGDQRATFTSLSRHLSRRGKGRRRRWLSTDCEYHARDLSAKNAEYFAKRQKRQTDFFRKGVLCIRQISNMASTYEVLISSNPITAILWPHLIDKRWPPYAYMQQEQKGLKYESAKRGFCSLDFSNAALNAVAKRQKIITCCSPLHYIFVFEWRKNVFKSSAASVYTYKRHENVIWQLWVGDKKG